MFLRVWPHANKIINVLSSDKQQFLYCCLFFLLKTLDNMLHSCYILLIKEVRLYRW
nr:MAG TPA: hypothetical protein [Caudoviricetes sp.]